jgi:hypothetical protein
VIVTPQLRFSRKQAENIEKSDPGEKNLARIALKTLSELAYDPTVIEWFSRLDWGLGLRSTATPREQERAIELASASPTRVDWKLVRRIGIADIVLALSSPEDLIPNASDLEGMAPLFKALRNKAYRERWKTVSIELRLRERKSKRDLDTIAETETIMPISLEDVIDRLIEIAREEGLSSDQVTILIAKVEKVGRNELPGILGWRAPKRVSAVWRSLAEDRWVPASRSALQRR